MLVDSRVFPANHIVKTNVCIIGAGPAGITLARELSKTSSHVVLLESGGKGRDPDVQKLNFSHTLDFEAQDVYLPAPRNRQLGGNSNMWSIKIGRTDNQEWTYGLRYVPLDDTDFEERDWVSNSGWPISLEDLRPYYQKAHELAHCGPLAYDASTWSQGQEQPVDWPGDIFTSKVFQFGPREVFYHDYAEELTQSQTVDILLYATAVELETDADSPQIQRVRVSNLMGKTYWVEANFFVLAMGGIETTRLMLASNQRQLSGLGNEHDLLGRFLMDHPLVDLGNLYPSSLDTFARTTFYDLRQVKGHPIMGHLAFKKEAMIKHRLLNNSLMLFPQPSLRQARAIRALQELAEKGYLQRPIPQNWPFIAKGLLEAIGGIDYLVLSAYISKIYGQGPLSTLFRGGWSEQPRTYGRFKRFEVMMMAEQAPNPTNRITLNKEHDALGMPGIDIRWEWGDVGREIAQRTQDLFADAVEQSGLGVFKPIYRDGERYFRGHGASHPMGTTRMSLLPSQGVVNPDCRVHSVPNLYVASSSVFPTSGYANATLTILALSLRLADHLKKELKSGQLVEVV